MTIHIGDKPLTAAYVGDKAVKQIYLGDDLIWPTAVELPEVGDPLMGGFFAGIIDTTRPGSIIVNDAYQTGLRYALIVSPKSLEGGSGTTTGDLPWRTLAADVPASKTLWNGLAAQQALASVTFPAFNYCAGLTYDSEDGASPWYLPAMDELELCWRTFKPDITGNATGARGASGTFPNPSGNQGFNRSTNPSGADYTTTVPPQTTVTVFKSGGAQAFELGRYYTTATSGDHSQAWRQGSGNLMQRLTNQSSGWQGQNYERVRPVRRLLLP